MKVYLAARYSRFSEMQCYARDLESLGCRVTSRWIKGNHEMGMNGQSAALWAQEDVDDLQQAALVVSFTEGPEDVSGRARGGRHVEFGLAFALNKRVIVVGPRENVFHFLPKVEVFETWGDFLSSLQKELAE